MTKICFNYKTVEGPWGGGNSFVRNLKKYLAQMPDMQIVEDEDQDYDLFFMNQLNRGPGRKKGRTQFISPWELARIHKYGHPSFLKMLSSLLSGRRDGKKIVARLTNLRSHSYNQNYSYRDWMLLNALKHTDMDIFQSEYIKGVFCRAGYSKKNCVVIYNGVNQKIFNLDGKKFWDGNYPVKVFSTAFASRESKRFDLIADFSELANVECTHIGTWPDGTNPKKVKLLGKMPQADFIRLFKEEAHIFLHPAEKDICPNGVIEALSTGLPVIFRNPGGTGEIVGDCGAEFRDSPKNALDLVLANYAKCLEGIRKNWSSYSIEDSAGKYAEVFRSLS